MNLSDITYYQGRRCKIVGVLREPTADLCGWYTVQFFDNKAHFLAGSHELEAMPPYRERSLPVIYFLFLLSQVVMCVILAAWSGYVLDPVFTLVGAGLTGLWVAELLESGGIYPLPDQK